MTPPSTADIPPPAPTTTAPPAPATRRPATRSSPRAVASAREEAPILRRSLPKVKGWRDCIRQWNHGDARAGIRPLKDWTQEDRSPGHNWTDREKGSHKSSLSTRKLIGEEYNLLGEQGFTETYAEFLRGGLNNLYKAIRNKKLEREQEQNDD